MVGEGDVEEEWANAGRHDAVAQGLLGPIKWITDILEPKRSYAGAYLCSGEKFERTLERVSYTEQNDKAKRRTCKRRLAWYYK